MKSILFIGFFLCSVAFTTAELQCEHKKVNVPTKWVDMATSCVQMMRGQIQKEINAAMQYMAMGAHFSRDTINRPGFAKTFFDAASEEREHAIKLIHYLLMRGELTSEVSSLISRSLVPETKQWASGVDALRHALKLETNVTENIRNVITTCENDEKFNDYHLVDYLTGEFLEEQYKGQREIAGRVSTLDKLMDKHGALGEFLFDKKLLNGEV